MNLERVGFNLRNFDMVFIWKDLNRDVGRIDTIPSTSLDTIKARAPAVPRRARLRLRPTQRGRAPLTPPPTPHTPGRRTGSPLSRSSITSPR